MQALKRGWKYIAVFVIALMVMLGMLVLAAKIPRSAIRANVRESAEYLCSGELFGTVAEGVEGSKIDRYADSILLAIAYLYSDRQPLTSVMWSSYYFTEYPGKEHNIIRFDSLYEEREYELIAVFYSQIFYTYEDVFKYYNFFQTDTQEEFDDWYDNIKEMSLYETGVTAEFGDEFITLSCCSYHVEDGRFVVVGRRINSPQYQE